MIKLSKHNRVALVTIDNERERNAITADMAGELEARFRESEADQSVRVVIVTAAGDRAFCAGHHLQEAVDAPDTLWRPEANLCFTAPQTMTKPVLAAINGAAYAGGLVLALSCDLRYCTPETTFVASAARIGLVPVGQQLTLLPQMVPPAIANEMLMLAKPLAAPDALAHGFVNAIHPLEDLLPSVMATAEALAAMPEASIAGIKRATSALLAHGPAAATTLEGPLAESAAAGPDVQEGLQAFLEKRKPKFGQTQTGCGHAY